MPYQSYSRATLKLRLQERWESSPFWTDEDANRSLNRTLRLWNALTGYWRTRLVLSTIPNDPLLPIPGTLVQQTALTWQGIPLKGMSVEEIQLLRTNWWYARGTPRYWAPVGLNLIAMYPTSTTAGSVGVDGIRQTPVLTADGDLVDIGPEEFSTLIGYALHDAALKGGTTLLTRTKGYLEAFLEAAGERNQFLRRTAWYTRLHPHPYAWSSRPSRPVVGAPEGG